MNVLPELMVTPFERGRAAVVDRCRRSMVVSVPPVIVLPLQVDDRAGAGRRDDRPPVLLKVPRSG